jgi:AraC-like DNA-binding protein
MTVSALSRGQRPAAAIDGAPSEDIPLRVNPQVLAGANRYDAQDYASSMHVHDLHQVLYAFQGVVEVETTSAHYFLPPQRALWIPAGLAHRTKFQQVRTMSIFFDTSLLPQRDDRARVLVVGPLFRELVIYAERWSIRRRATDRIADAYFASLANLLDEWLDFETPFSIPTSQDPLVAAAMSFTAQHLAELSLRQVCQAVGLSERTLRRRFQASTGMTWRQYLLQARLLRAMALLAVGESSIVRVAASVGFESASSFTRAFTRYTGDTPTQYRTRAATESS